MLRLPQFPQLELVLVLASSPGHTQILCEIKSGRGLGTRLIKGHIFSVFQCFIQLICTLCIQLQHNVHAGKLVQITGTYG